MDQSHTPAQAIAPAPVAAPRMSAGAFLLIAVVHMACTGLGLWGANAVAHSQHWDTRTTDEWKAAHDNGVKYDVAFVGNSLMIESLIFNELSALTGKNILQVTKAGSSTSLWYISIKKLIGRNIPAEHKPAYTVLFFRDSELTSPTYNAFGYRLIDVINISAAEDTLINSVYLRPTLGPVSYALFLRSEAYRHKEWIRQGVYEGSSFIAAALSGRTTKSVSGLIRNAMQSTKKVGGSFTGKRENFEAALPTSFLPSILDELQEQNIRPIFARVRLRAHARPEEGESPATTTYMAKLRVYLEERNVLYLDYSGETRLQEEHFADDIHLNDTGKKIFTPILAKDLQKIFSSQY